MTLLEFINRANIQNVTKAYIAKFQCDWDAPYDEERLYKEYKSFIKMLNTLTPKAHECDLLLVPVSYHDEDGVESVDVACFHKDELKKYAFDNVDVCDYDYDEVKNMSNETLHEQCLKIINDMPQSYAFDFVPWEELLEAEVFPGYDSYIWGTTCETEMQCAQKKDEFVASILYELTFHGMTKEEQDDRRTDLEERIKETKKAIDKGDTSHFVPFEDVLKELEETLGTSFTRPTQEEIEEASLNMMRSSLDWHVNAYNSIFDYIVENEDPFGGMEVGNLLFGHSRGRYKVSPRDTMQEIFVNFLDNIGADMYGIICKESPAYQRSIDQEEYGFDCDLFTLRPYYWGDDEDIANLPNFVYKPEDIEIRWYKYPMRDAYSNTNLIPEKLKEICDKCEKRVARMAEENK